MNAWVEKLIQPIDDTDIGVDPRNSDEFYELKQEVNKVSGIDYGLLQQKAETILQKQGKDLRVASYLVVARTNLDGFTGLCESLNLLGKLVEQYGKALYPAKISSKLISIKWLNEARIKHMIMQKIDVNDARQTKVLLRTIESINKQLSKNLDEEAKLFSHILPLLRAQHVSNVQPIQQQTAANDQPTRTSGIDQCHSEDDLRELTRLQCQYLRQQNQWLRAIAYSRAYRWGALQELRADNNATSVPAPDENVISNFQRVVDNAAPMDVLHAGEDLFMTKGGLYYFDCHYQQIIAARAMNMNDVAAFIEDELKQLLLRFPKLINFTYANNLAFISVEHRPWLEQLLKPAASSARGASSTNCELNLADMVNSYRAMVAGKTLVNKVRAINELPATSQRLKCQQQLALARFCIEDKRVDLAVPMLQQLADLVDQYQLQLWEPEFALFIWSELSAALKLQLPKLDKDMQKQVKMKLEKLFNNICVTDLSRALN